MYGRLQEEASSEKPVPGGTCGAYPGRSAFLRLAEMSKAVAPRGNHIGRRMEIRNRHLPHPQD